MTDKTQIVVGCNYHTKWQSKKGMRFVLVEVKGDKARLQTRNSRKDFWTNLSDLIFIETDYNIAKAKVLTAPDSKIPDWVNNLP
jgi:hypothetical protein